MNETHVELIAPAEKISPNLGGTGYVGPTQSALPAELYANALSAAVNYPDLNATVWKVLRSSVNWTQRAKTRRLYISGHIVPCEVIGGTSEWWFVFVDATVACEKLKAAQ